MAYEIIIDKNNSGVSPKGFLNKKLDVSYNRIFRFIKDKRITLNGKKIKPEMKLSEGDVIKIWLDEIKLKKESTKNLKKCDLKIPIIFENDDFLVLNKLPNIIVQGAQDNDTSLSLHLNFLQNKNKDDKNYFHVHRLDKDTSGVLICSKNQIALRNLNEIFRTKNVVKKYVCLCIGKFDKKEEKIEINLERAPQGSKEKTIVVKAGGKKSISYYKVLKEYEKDKQIFTLVEVEIKTGITHQIRVHMKYLNHPIVCDKMYGNSFVNKMFEGILERQFLHAKSLEFKYENKFYKFEAELINDLNNAIEFIK